MDNAEVNSNGVEVDPEVQADAKRVVNRTLRVDKSLMVRISEEEYEALAAVAREQNASVSETVRRMIRRYIGPDQRSKLPK